MPIATPQGTLDFKSVDKVTFVGASSNTVIDTTTGSLGVGVDVNGPTSNLHVVGHTRLEGDINMLHTANTASIKLNSNVVTEFPRSKKLIKYPRVALTSAAGESSGYQGFYVTESSNSANTNRHSWKAFDMTFATDTSDNGWANGVDDYSGSGNTYQGSSNLGTGAVDGEWIKLQLPHKIRLEYMKIWLKDNDPTRIPDSWILYGSDDNTNWTELFSKTGQGAVHENTYNVNANSMYNYLAVVVTKISGQPNYFRIMELEYYGVPEYDPEAHGVDVKVTSYPNVPNTDWLEVYYDGKDLTDGAVTSVDDLTPGGTNDGTPYGGVTVSDGAFVLDGTNDYITTPALGFSGDQVHSVSLWFWSDKPQSDMTTEHGIYGIGRSINPLNNTNSARGGLSWWSPATQPNSSLRFWHSGSAGRNFPGTTFLEGKWNHVLIVYPGGGAFNIRAWLNGVELTGANGTGSGGNNYDFNWNTNDHIILGDWYTGTGTVKLQSPWDGKIANFRLFNRALTTDEIYQLYAYQKEYFGHGDLSMTLKAGRLGIGTSEPRAALDVRGDVRFSNVPHIYATDDGGYDDANGAYINFDRVESSNGIALIGTDGTFRITEQAGAGVYYVDGSVSYHQSNGTEVRNLELKIYLNGVSHHSNNRNYGLTAMKHVGGSTYSDLGVTALVKCNVGDTIRLYGISRSSSINVHTPNNKMVIFKVQST